ncbi:ROK family protein [Bacillus sp. sid0103]|uniref:ROK family protein n=1 Tax=Bacillus sp. sid0103 TaxID=2856337 RepID=UPI001C488664|nr:ROK family protein [Bacillus sp. sid0103]MBV7504361.1 ROK family protein [Bacillus sp. sid0103]
MYNHYYLAFDVGGLFIKGVVLNDRGEIFPNTESYFPSKSGANREEILTHFVEIICRQIGKIMDKNAVIEGIGFAFPGPFDYVNGVCLISGVNKFESLYGVDLRTELTARLHQQKVFAVRVSPQFRIVFENNVNMFALGEWFIGEAKEYQRVLYLTLGNGTGSAFMENGEIIKDRDDIPPNGWVYCLPFHESIVDDYMSTRGILRIAQQLHVNPNLGLIEMANAARTGKADEKEVFRRFGRLLGEMLVMVMKPFQPNALVIGGQIAKSHELFKDELESVLKNENVIIELSNQTSYSTFIGLSKAILLKQMGQDTMINI